MGLCYSHNTALHGKANYPYKEIIPLAVLLWRYHLPQVNTIVRLVYTESELTDEMRSYGAMLERTGAVVEWVPAGNLSCVTMSQIVRSVTRTETSITRLYHLILRITAGCSLVIMLQWLRLTLYYQWMLTCL